MHLFVVFVRIVFVLSCVLHMMTLLVHKQISLVQERGDHLIDHGPRATLLHRQKLERQ